MTYSMDTNLPTNNNVGMPDLGSEVAELYGDLLARIADTPGLNTGNLTFHWPVVGQDFDRGLLVVGQAVYGWITDWPSGTLRSSAGRREVVNDARDLFKDRADPMDWLAGHGVANSPFWRTAHEVVDALTPGPSPWYSRLAWANLYPVAPNDYKGNPEGQLRGAQTASAARLLAAVIERLNPSLVLVLAGPYIWPFVGPLGLEALDRASPPFTLVGSHRGRTWICGMHPGGAQRRGWPARQYAALVVEQAHALNSL